VCTRIKAIKIGFKKLVKISQSYSQMYTVGPFHLPTMYDDRKPQINKLKTVILSALGSFSLVHYFDMISHLLSSTLLSLRM